MFNKNLLKNYILKKQKNTHYTSEELDKLTEDKLKGIIIGLLTLNQIL